MFRILEGKYQPLAPLRVFYSRLAKAFLATIGVIAFSLAMGTCGYHYIIGQDWMDALLSSSMILTGMGPMGDPPKTDSGKLFAVFYCLYSGIAFLSLVAIIMAPVYHRFLHRFNLDEEGQPYLPPRADPPPMTTDM
jgi:hypothetical protein